MKLLNVCYTLALPPDVTVAEAEEWLMHRLELGAIQDSNPLLDKSQADLIRRGSLSTYEREIIGVWPA